ncbi:MAG: acetolactate synthase small subunit [Longimicrobiales bacterium]|nr:acetolactate synthase small subunit [Longimicrobiales bacterium]
MRHVISILLQNESGALARVATMFASRGFNIESLSVAPTPNEVVSRLTLVTVADDDKIDQINKQLQKLVDVVAIQDRTTVDHIERELALVKFRVPEAATDDLVAKLEEHGGRVLDSDPAHFTVEMTGNESDLDAFLSGLSDDVEVVTVVRSGVLAISRGPRSLGTELDL